MTFYEDKHRLDQALRPNGAENQLSKRQICQLWSSFVEKELISKYEYHRMFKPKSIVQRKEESPKKSERSPQQQKAEDEHDYLEKLHLTNQNKFTQLDLQICQEIQELDNLQQAIQSKFTDKIVETMDFYLEVCKLQDKQPKYFKDMLLNM